MAQLGDIDYLEYEMEEYFRQRVQKVLEYQRLKHNFRESGIVGVEWAMGVMFYVIPEGNSERGTAKFTEDELKDTWVEVEDDEEPTELVYPYEAIVAKEFEEFIYDSKIERFDYVVVEEINKVLGYGQD